VKDPAWRLCFNGPGNGIQLQDGTLVFPAQYKVTVGDPAAKVPAGRPYSCFIASRDGGRTWRISPAAIPDGVPTSEAAIAELSDGGLLLSMRNESRSGERAWAQWRRTSGGDGKPVADILQGRWSASWLRLPDPTCMASLIRHPQGLLVFSNPADSQQRRMLTVRTSRDDGQSWSRGQVLDPDGAQYSSLTVLSDGQLGILYESTEARGLVFARFPLDWVLEGVRE
jgi:sialidase-1